MNEWETLIAQLGFPIAIAIYLLVVGRQSIDAMKKSLDNNTKAIQELVERLKKNG